MSQDPTFNVKVHAITKTATIPVKAENKELAVQSVDYLLKNNPEELEFNTDFKILITCKEVNPSDKN